MSIDILVSPAKPHMVDWFFMDHDIIDDLGLKTTKQNLLWQIENSWALSFKAGIPGYSLTPLALAGLFCDPDTNEGQVWFRPTISMPVHYRALLRILPRYIKCLGDLSDCSRITTLLDPDNKNFKKFATLVKFRYSSDLDINGVSFEEWEFRG